MGILSTLTGGASTLVADRWRAARIEAEIRRQDAERRLQSGMIEADLQRREGRLITQYAELLAEPELAEPDPDEEDWTAVGDTTSKTGLKMEPAKTRTKARQLALANPIGKNVLSQLANYVFGYNEGLGLHFVLAPGIKDSKGKYESLLDAANVALNDFFGRADDDNGDEVARELGHRTWRDGETFGRVFPSNGRWPPAFAFADPELVDAPLGGDGPAQGIRVDDKDCRRAIEYAVLKEPGGELDDMVPADRMVHVKINADGNQLRGVTLFYPVMDWLRKFNSWIDTELIARKVASSFVLIRRWKGRTSGQVESHATDQQTGTTKYPEGTLRRQKVRPGTILDINDDVELDTVEHKGAYTDADALGRRILLMIASGLNMPEYMLTSDASNAAFASTLVAEAPAVRAFTAWQWFYVRQMRKLVRRAFAFHPELAGFMPILKLTASPPRVATRDRKKDMEGHKIAWEIGAISPQEVARQDNLDPEQMRKELAESFEEDPAVQVARKANKTDAKPDEGADQGGTDET